MSMNLSTPGTLKYSDCDVLLCQFTAGPVWTLEVYYVHQILVLEATVYVHCRLLLQLLATRPVATARSA